MFGKEGPIQKHWKGDWIKLLSHSKHTNQIFLLANGLRREASFDAERCLAMHCSQSQSVKLKDVVLRGESCSFFF